MKLAVIFPCSKDFTDYADICFREFGNHIKFWTTINEGNIFAIGGYTEVGAPPGRCSLPYTNCLSSGNSSTETYIAAHNLLLAHASVSSLYKKKYKKGSVGLSIFTLGFTTPSSNDDVIATQRAKYFYIGWMLGPLIYGDYPDEMRRTVGSRLPFFSMKESELVKGSSDFIGVIHYLAANVTNIKTKPSLSENPTFYSDMGVSFPVSPWALEETLEYIKQSFGNPPVYILENGKPMKGQPEDIQRIEYMQAYIGSMLSAVRNGSNTRGYFVWSFMDLYELLKGYEFGFGLYSVNFSDPHRKRSPRLSAHWYSGFLKGQNAFIESQSIMELQTNFSTSVL